MAHAPITKASFAKVSNYDSVKIAGVLLPITMGSLQGGTKLDIQRAKSKGADFARYKSQGLDSFPVIFELSLFIDLYTGFNWIKEYDKVKDKLIPRGLDKRNAIDIYHPSLAEDGILSIVPIEKPILRPVGVDRFTVVVQAMDTRTAPGGSKAPSKTKTPAQANGLRTAGPAQLPPSSKLQGTARKSFP